MSWYSGQDAFDMFCLNNEGDLIAEFDDHGHFTLTDLGPTKTSAQWMDLLFPDTEVVTYTGWPSHRDGVWWHTTPISQGDFLLRLAMCPTRPNTGPGSYTGWLEKIKGRGCGG